MTTGSLPPRHGLYDPRFEHDSCGVGFIANIKGVRSHAIISDGLKILNNLSHRGAVGAGDRCTGARDANRLCSAQTRPIESTESKC